MFKFLFKRSKIYQWEIDLIKNCIRLLPVEYLKLLPPIEAGLYNRVLLEASDIKGFIAFTFNPKVYSQFENEKDGYFVICDLFVFDVFSNDYLPFEIHVSNGVVCGYTLNVDEKFQLDVKKIKVDNYYKKVDMVDDFNSIKSIFNKVELELINPSIVQKVEIEGKEYYKIKELEDGDFIAVNLKKEIFMCTHDPYEVKILRKRIEEILP